MDFVLKYVKALKISADAKRLCKMGEFEGWAEALNMYSLAISLVNPPHNA